MKSLILIIMIFLISGCNQTSECKDYPFSECPDNCVLCPPCEACSSISCQTEEFCNSIGFNRSWYEEIKTRLNE